MKILYALSALSYLALAALIGYYSYEKDGVLSVFNNTCFFLLGMLFYSAIFNICYKNQNFNHQTSEIEKEK